MHFVKNVTLAASLALFALPGTAFSQSVHDTSQASALSSAGLSAAVAFVPLSVTIGGSALASMTLEHLSRFLGDETEWIVEQVSGRRADTALTIKSNKHDAIMIVGVPRAQVVLNDIVVNSHVHFEQLGPQSYALKHGETAIGIYAPGDRKMGHSIKRQ